MSREYVLQPFRPPVHLQIDYARELNEQQLAAVTAPPGPSLVIAGAGSGKTRTLTYRVAYLLEQGIPPERILLLTFTNKASKEMMRRVADLLGQEMASLWGGTFHSIGNRILRQEAARLGFQRDFTILDREDARHLMTTCIAESGLQTAETRFPKPDVLVEVFSLALNTQKDVPTILKEQYGYFAHLAPQLVELQRRYQARKVATNALDFDDLLALWLRLLQEFPDLREHYQRRFQFILVDEYQDTNKLQSELIDLLAARHRNVMVVGDDAQSIYAWRGANYQNILEFPKRYPQAKVYKIETNYRSTPEILQVANAAISANVHQFTKELTPARKGGTRPILVACGDSAEQAAFVSQRVLELREEGGNLNNMAVLYRSHFHALELQLELTRRNIPFSITSGIRFFEQAHIKDATAYLKLVLNPRDELSFKRLVQLLPGIGGKGAEKLWAGFGGRRGNGKWQMAEREWGRTECRRQRLRLRRGVPGRRRTQGVRFTQQAADSTPPPRLCGCSTVRSWSPRRRRWPGHSLWPPSRNSRPRILGTMPPGCSGWWSRPDTKSTSKRTLPITARGWTTWSSLRFLPSNSRASRTSSASWRCSPTWRPRPSSPCKPMKRSCGFRPFTRPRAWSSR